jgi:hypothetical protein
VACGELTDIAREVATSVADMKTTLVRVLRTRVQELDRRLDSRIPVQMQARLESAPERWQGAVVDISTSGVRLEGTGQPVGGGGALQAGDAATLSVEGLPAVPVRVVRREGGRLHLRFDYADAAQRQRMEAAIAALAHRRAA